MKDSPSFKTLIKSLLSVDSFCKKCSKHSDDLSRMKDSFFRIYPFLYKNKAELPKFKEKRFIMKWKRQFNTYQQIVKI